MKKLFNCMVVITLMINFVVLAYFITDTKMFRKQLVENNVRVQLPEGFKRIKDAEAAFALYQAEPTNEVAILYLQIAIRKNPSELKYIRTLKDVVEKSGLTEGLVREYQAMLSYCLDETSEECFKDLVTMVKELRAGIAKLEVGDDEPEEPSVDLARVAELREQLSTAELITNELVVAFHKTARKVAERRVGILKELISLEGATDASNLDCSCAEVIGFVARAKERIDGYIKQADREILNAGEKAPTTEAELRDALTALGATAISQPIVLAQQTVQSLYGLDLSALPANIAKACVDEFRTLDRLVKNSFEYVGVMKAKKINAYVDGLGAGSAESSTRKYTDRLENLDKQGKVISKYIGCISNMETANEVLVKQLEILDKSRKLQRERSKIYQKNAADEMKEIAHEIKKYKGEAWSKEYKKNQAEPLLEKLAKINPALLVPEVNELYQYEYSQLTTDFNAWVEKEKAYEYKAAFMVELAKIEKSKLEDL